MVDQGGAGAGHRGVLWQSAAAGFTNFELSSASGPPGPAGRHRSVPVPGGEFPGSHPEKCTFFTPGCHARGVSDYIGMGGNSGARSACGRHRHSSFGQRPRRAVRRALRLPYLRPDLPLCARIPAATLRPCRNASAPISGNPSSAPVGGISHFQGQPQQRRAGSARKTPRRRLRPNSPPAAPETSRPPT